MSKKDLDAAIHRFDRSSEPEFRPEPPPSEQGDAVCFDIKGQWTPSETKCAAKHINGQRGERFFVKFCLDGPDKGHLLNPYSVYFRDGDDVAIATRRGKLRYEFRQVSKTAFQNYIHFLKTRTYSYCQQAEREVLNGG